MVTEKDAKKMLKSTEAQSKAILNNKDDLAKLLLEVEKFLKKIPHVGTDLAVVPNFVSLLKDYSSGAYKEIPFNSLLAVVGALVYLINPLDIVPDFIPYVGMLDDVAIVKLTLGLIKSDLKNYNLWRVANGKK